MSVKEPSSVDVFFTGVLGCVTARRYNGYVNSFGLTGSERVLDYGSGSGRISRPIAQRLLQAGGHLTCVVVSEVWMNSIRKRLEKYPDVDFRLGDITSLPIEDYSYDVILVHFVLHHIDRGARNEKVRALSEKLTAGGRLFIREPVRQGHGTPVDERLELMTNAGLRERSSRLTRSLAMGPVYEGVFQRLDLGSI